MASTDGGGGGRRWSVNGDQNACVEISVPWRKVLRNAPT